MALPTTTSAVLELSFVLRNPSYCMFERNLRLMSGCSPNVELFTADSQENQTHVLCRPT